MNGIARESAIFSIEAAADHTASAGIAVVLSSGTAAVCTSATAEPYGVILDGAASGDQDSIAAFAGGPGIGTVLVKLDATPGTVIAGTNLVITATGTFKADPGTGSRQICAQAQESGAANELIEAVIFKPVSAS